VRGVHSRPQFTYLKMRGFILPILATAVLSKASSTSRSEHHPDETLINTAIPSDKPSSKRAVGTWDDAYTKATAALAKLSQNDKIGIVTGVGWQNGNCVGNTKAASSIGYPSLCLQGKQTRFTSSRLGVKDRFETPGQAVADIPRERC
jgi:hypothetical protein